jgi:hypothetical protein
VILVRDANHRNAQTAMRAFHEFAVFVVIDRRIGGVAGIHGLAMEASCRRRAIQGLATAGAQHRYDFPRIQR